MAEATALLGGGLGALLDWFYPRHCYHCESPIDEARGRVLCRTCYDDLKARRITGGLCATCGLPLEVEAGEQARCATSMRRARSSNMPGRRPR
jgi:predicted amidophosphoribosyltransferase